MQGPSKFSRTAEILFCLAISALHLTTWWAPRVGSDEVAFADFALYHDIHLYRDLLPPDLAILRSGYGFGLIPIYMAVLRFVLRTCGVGIASIRLVPMGSGLVVLALLYWLIRRTEGGFWPTAGLIFFATSTPFFLTTHTVRAEAIILLINVVNVAWWLLNGPRFVGILLGALTGLGFGIYPSAVYIVATILTLAMMDRRDGPSRTDHIVLWCVGLAVGFWAVIQWIDIEQAARYFSVQNYLYRSLWIQKPAFASHPLNVLHSLNEGLSTMAQSAGPGSAYYPYWLAWLLAALLIQFRRPWSMLRAERLVVGAAAAAWVAHSLLTISTQTHSYALFFFPWWIWQSGFVMRRIFQRTLNVDMIDVITLCLCTVIFAVPSQHVTADILLACLFVLTTIPRNKTYPLAWTTIARWSIAFYGILSSCVILGTDHLRIPARLRQAVIQERMVQREVVTLRGETRIIGPMTLWLYDSDLNLRSLDFEFLGLNWDPTPWIVAYQPTLILWPRSSLPRLNALLLARYPTLSLSPVSSWVIPTTYATDFVGLRLQIHHR